MTGTCEGCRGRVRSRPSDAVHLLPQLPPSLPSCPVAARSSPGETVGKVSHFLCRAIAPQLPVSAPSRCPPSHSLSLPLSLVFHRRRLLFLLLLRFVLPPVGRLAAATCWRRMEIASPRLNHCNLGYSESLRLGCFIVWAAQLLARQEEGRGFNSRTWPFCLEFLVCLCGFCPSTQAFCHSPTTRMLS